MQKPGDWNCPSCGDLQFARNTQCRKCGAANPLLAGSGSATALRGGCGLKPGDWYCPACKDFQFARNAKCNKCGEANPNPTNASGNSLPQKPGDWTCPSCGDLQFAKNMACRRCGAANPNPLESLRAMQEGLSSMQERISKPGDWTCPNCGDLVFARNTNCRKCLTANPTAMVQGGVFSMLMGNMGGLGAGKGGGSGTPAPRTGDWFCPTCHDLQFARNSQCKRCGTPSPVAVTSAGVVGAPPTQAMMPGDWICPSCNDLVFARNDACRRCSTQRTAAVATAPPGQKGGGLMCLAGMQQVPLTRPQWALPFAAATQVAQAEESPQEQTLSAVEAPPEQVQEQEQPTDALDSNVTDHVYVKGLPENMTSDWLPKFLQMEDKVTWCKIVWSRNGESHALVQFDCPESALWAVQNLNGQASPEHGTVLIMDFHRTRTMGAKAQAASFGSWTGGYQALGVKRPLLLQAFGRPY